MDERSGPLPRGRLRLRRRRDGMPAQLVTLHFHALSRGAIPSRGPPEAPVVDLELGKPYGTGTAVVLSCGRW
jgi:hypothetical protein